MRVAPLSRWLPPLLVAFTFACSSASTGDNKDGSADGHKADAADAAKDTAPDKGTGGVATDGGGTGGGSLGGKGGNPTGGNGGVATGGSQGGHGGGEAGHGGATGGSATGGSVTGGAGGGAAGFPAGGTGGAAGHGGAGTGGQGGQGGQAVVPTCQDKRKNGDETDVDCGGHCGPCGPTKTCTTGSDCSLGVCTSGGTCAACAAPSDCPGQDFECAHRTCTNGVCGTANEPADKVLATQIVGDCKVRRCGPSGGVVQVADENDKPNDANPCTADSCVNTTEVFAPVASGTACGGAGSSMVCDYAAHCVGCLVASTCPGTDTPCRTRTCTNHVCGFDLKPAGMKLTDPTAGDCKGLVCDDKGDPQVANLDTDLPVDGNPCTTDLCSNGTASHAPVDSGTDCGGGKICDGANRCVECLSAGACSGADTECKTRTCVNGMCGVSFANANKVLSAQVAGDCKIAVCDGQGNVTVAAATDDIPSDNNPCTADVCSGLTPMNMPVTMGTGCGITSVCDDMGHCVGCNAAADCGLDTECTAYTCMNHVCGAVQSPGKVVMSQVSDDCHLRVCDANGQIVSQVDPTDNDDGNPCTEDSCADGTPQHLPSTAGKTCVVAGNANVKMCNGDGASPACVACVRDSDCPGTTNACQHPSCNSGVCGMFRVAASTPLASNLQTAGDCHLQVCDGNGNILDNVDDTDTPADDGNQCTTEACTAGAPGHTGTPGIACSQNGGSVCDNETVPKCSPAVWAVRVDNGATALGSAATPVFIDRIAVLDGSDAGTTIALPTVMTGNNQPFSLSGTASSDGALALSADGRYVTLAGYNATPTTAGITSSTTITRGVALIDKSAVVDTSTVFTGKFSANNVRSAVSTDGDGVWAAGAGGTTAGLYYTTKGSMASPTAVTTQNSRVCQIWLGQLYCSWSASSQARFDAIGKPGAVPTTAATATAVANATTNSSSPFGYALFDLDGDNAPDVLYLTDDRSVSGGNGGIWRFKIDSFDTTAANSTAISVTKQANAIGAAPANLPTGDVFTPNFRGLTGYVDASGKVNLLVTNDGSGSTKSYVIRYVDDPNMPVMTASVAGTILKTAGTNALYRGVALAPR